MGKALTKAQQEKLEAMNKPTVGRTEGETKFDQVQVPRISINNKKGQFSIYEDEENKLLGDKISVRPILFGSKFMRSVNSEGKWKVEMETIVRTPSVSGTFIDNVGTIAGGRLLGKPAKSLSYDDQKLNREKAAWYGTLYAIYEGSLVQIKLPAGKAMAVSKFLEAMQDMPVSNQIDLSINDDDKLGVATSKVGLKVTSDELEMAETAQEHVDQHNFFTVIFFNRSRDKDEFDLAQMSDYLSSEFMDKYDIDDVAPQADKPVEGGETELDDDIPF